MSKTNLKNWKGNMVKQNKRIKKKQKQTNKQTKKQIKSKSKRNREINISKQKLMICD